MQAHLNHQLPALNVQAYCIFIRSLRISYRVYDPRKCYGWGQPKCSVGEAVARWSLASDWPMWVPPTACMRTRVS